MASIPSIPNYTSPVPIDLLAPPGAPWYALQTQPRHEKKVAAQLVKKHVDTFLPLVSESHRWSDRQKIIQVPLFPSYAFVRVASTAEARLAVLRTPGVLRFLGSPGEDHSVPDKQIEDIRSILAQRVSCTLYPFLRVGQRVRIRGGSLDGIEGLLVALEGARGMVISVDSILQSIAIRVEGYDLEVLAPPAGPRSAKTPSGIPRLHELH
ncbi:MAG: UpxY family transcription antiterminator [Acidobacteria bacterium]|nr:UpxY family transcription antiterminator [Acidobacteriota bacterium]